MSKAKTLRLNGALRKHLQAITTRKATWHNYHQAAVLLSDQAETLWRATGPKTKNLQCEHLQLAISYLDHALHLLGPTRAKRHPHYWLAATRVACDMAIVTLRLARTIRNHSLARQAAESLLSDGGIPEIKLQLSQAAQAYPTYKWQCLHQAAIAGMVEFSLYSGHVFGLSTTVQLDKAKQTEDDTLSRFQGMLDQASPDNERSYRSFLLLSAQFNEWCNDRPRRYQLAMDALGSAWQFRDAVDGTRALALLIGGQRLRNHLSTLRLVVQAL